MFGIIFLWKIHLYWSFETIISNHSSIDPWSKVQTTKTTIIVLSSQPNFRMTGGQFFIEYIAILKYGTTNRIRSRTPNQNRAIKSDLKFHATKALDLAAGCRCRVARCRPRPPNSIRESTAASPWSCSFFCGRPSISSLTAVPCRKANITGRRPACRKEEWRCFVAVRWQERGKETLGSPNPCHTWTGPSGLG